jgi:hypothetical protein
MKRDHLGIFYILFYPLLSSYAYARRFVFVRCAGCALFCLFLGLVWFVELLGCVPRGLRYTALNRCEMYGLLTVYDHPSWVYYCSVYMYYSGLVWQM